MASKLLIHSEFLRKANRLPWVDLEELEPGLHYETKRDLDALRQELNENGVACRARLFKGVVRSLALTESKAIIYKGACRAYKELLPWISLDRVESDRHYYSKNISAVRRDLHQLGVLPHVRLTDATQIKALVLRNEMATTIFPCQRTRRTSTCGA